MAWTIKELTDVSGRLFIDGDTSVSKEVRDDESSLFVESSRVRSGQFESSRVRSGQLKLGQEAQYMTIITSLVELHEPCEVALGRSWYETDTVGQ